MSGRSAFARAQKEKQADRNYLQNRYGDPQWQEQYLQDSDARHSNSFRRLSIDSLPSAPQPHPLSVEPSSHSRQQQRNDRQQYLYRAPPPKQLRPIVIASAIDKSDFRTHLDGLTDSVRGKLGRMVGMKKEKDLKRPESTASYRRASVTLSPPPPVNAVPPLIPSLPSPQKAFPFAARPSSGTQGRPSSHESGLPAVGVFHGSGRTYFHDWKSHLAVCQTLSGFLDDQLIIAGCGIDGS